MATDTAKNLDLDISQVEEIWKTAVPKIIENNIRTKGYLANAPIIDFTNNQLTIAVPNIYTKKKLNDFKEDILPVIRELTSQPIEIEFKEAKDICEANKDKEPKLLEDPTPKQPQPNIPAYLTTPTNSFYNPILKKEYTFEGFATGPENNEAVQFAKLFTDPQTIPLNKTLYIFGQYGLGKTHLSQACIKHAKQIGMKAQWTSGEALKKLWVKAYKENKYNDFDSVFQNQDLLVIDNVQTIAGGSSTQKKLLEILHLYNQEGRRIIITSYLSPHEMKKDKGIHENLRGLFTKGTNAQIQKPSLETRIAILKKKAEIFGAPQIDESILTYLATTLTQDTRELESGIVNLISHASLKNQEYSLKLAEQVVTNLTGTQNILNEEYIKKIVCQNYGISIEQIESSSRKDKIAKARQLGFFLMRQYLNTPLKSIGKHFGNKQHATVIYGINQTEEKLETNAQFKSEVVHITKQLGIPIKEAPQPQTQYKATQTSLFTNP